MEIHQFKPSPLTIMNTNKLSKTIATHPTLPNTSMKTHPFRTIQKTTQILEYHKKGAHLNTLERFHIHTEHKANNHLNDEHTIFPNAIFDTLLKNNQP